VVEAWIISILVVLFLISVAIWWIWFWIVEPLQVDKKAKNQKYTKWQILGIWLVALILLSVVVYVWFR
jgi:hypothetical protein